MDPVARTHVDGESVTRVRLGHGANCSSIGSVVDTLFVTSLGGGAIFAAVLGALGNEPGEVVGPVPAKDDADQKAEEAKDAP